MGIKITTDDYGVKVWRSDNYGYPQYAIAIGTKTDDGQRVSEYQQVQFRRGVELENGEEILIKDAFPTLRTWKDKQTGETRHKMVWMITDFIYKPQQHMQGTQMQMQSQFTDLPDTFEATEDEIPF